MCSRCQVDAGRYQVIGCEPKVHNVQTVIATETNSPTYIRKIRRVWFTRSWKIAYFRLRQAATRVKDARIGVCSAHTKTSRSQHIAFAFQCKQLHLSQILESCDQQMEIIRQFYSFLHVTSFPNQAHCFHIVSCSCRKHCKFDLSTIAKRLRSKVVPSTAFVNHGVCQAKRTKENPITSERRLA